MADAPRWRAEKHCKEDSMQRRSMAAAVILAVLPLLSGLSPAATAAPEPTSTVTSSPATTAQAAPVPATTSTGDCRSLTGGANRNRLAMAVKTGKTSLPCVQWGVPTNGVHTDVLPAPDWCGIGQW